MDYIIASVAVTDEIHFPDKRVIDRVPGGAGVYALAGIRLWTDEVMLVTGVGRDFDSLFGNWYRNNNISMEGLLIKDQKTPHTVITYFPDGERTEKSLYGTEHFSKMEITAKELCPYFGKAKGIYIFRNADLIFWGEILNAKKSSGTKILWEISKDAAAYDQLSRVRRIAEQVDILSLNQAEAFSLLGVSTKEEAIERLGSWKVPLIYFRMGEKGACMITKDQIVEVESEKDILVMDTTGGGNSSSGAVLYGYCENLPLEEVGRLGSRAAAICIAQYGVPENMNLAKQISEKKGNSMNQIDNAMRRQVFSLPELIREQYEDLEPKTRIVLSFQEQFNIQRIVLTGCGDSYAACMAAKYTFEMLTGILTEVVPAIELSRFYCDKQLGVDCQNPLVIAVSNSGQVARISEAVQRARKYGCFVLGVTGNEESELGINSNRILKLSIPSFESAPGTRSYAASLIALNLLAIRFGEVRGAYTMDQAMEYRFDLRNQGEALQKLLPEMDKTIQKVALEWKEMPCYDFTGAGFDYATAWFGQAKILEAVGTFAMHINVEEWFHLNFFARKAKEMGTVVVANTTNPGLSRTVELIHYAGVLGRPLLVITEGSPEELRQKIESVQKGNEKITCKAVFVRVPSPAFPINMPVTQFAPLCLLAGYLSVLNDEKYGRGCEGVWSFCEDGHCVKSSEIIVS